LDFYAFLFSVAGLFSTIVLHIIEYVDTQCIFFGGWDIEDNFSTRGIFIF